MRRNLVAVIFALLAVSAFACLWDRDTLSEEAERSQDAIDAIVGRFPRNPPLYYEMRLARVKKELIATPRDLSLYDDAAVACDRLGRSSDGINWLAKKREILDETPLASGKNLDHWYRYYANVGTLRVHRWLAEGGQLGTISQLKEAIAEIEQAVKINPAAHFGRERTQLGIMKLVLLERVPNSAVDSGEAAGFILDGSRARTMPPGLIGLVSLGGAWQSPDVMAMLASAKASILQGKLSQMADWRREELLRDGRKHLLDSSLKEFFAAGRFQHQPQTRSQLRQAYETLRRDADAYHAHRTAFMQGRMKQGQHPDTDSKFWDGYVETPRADITQFEPSKFSRWIASPGNQFYLFVGILMAIPITIFVGLRIRAKRSLNPKRPVG